MENHPDVQGEWMFAAMWWVTSRRLRPFARILLATQDDSRQLSMVYDYVQPSGEPGERAVTFLDDENTLGLTLQEQAAGTCTAHLRTGSGSCGADVRVNIPPAILDEVYAFCTNSPWAEPGAPPCDEGLA